MTGVTAGFRDQATATLRLPACQGGTNAITCCPQLPPPPLAPFAAAASNHCCRLVFPPHQVTSASRHRPPARACERHNMCVHLLCIRSRSTDADASQPLLRTHECMLKSPRHVATNTPPPCRPPDHIGVKVKRHLCLSSLLSYWFMVRFQAAADTPQHHNTHPGVCCAQHRDARRTHSSRHKA